MNEQKSGQGGAANTPPFPRLAPEPAVGSTSEQVAGEPAGGPAPGGREADVAEPGVSEPKAPEAGGAEAGGAGAGVGGAATEAEAGAMGAHSMPGGGEPTSGESSPAAATPPPSPEPMDEPPARGFAARTEEVRRRAEEGVQRGFERFADRLDDAAEHIERLADDQLSGPGARGRAGEVAQSTAGWIEEAAEYLRTSDLRQVRSDLERQVREKPLQSLLLAAGAGWLLGKIMR